MFPRYTPTYCYHRLISGSRPKCNYGSRVEIEELSVSITMVMQAAS